MNLLDLARTIPMLSALTWLSVVLLQVARLRIRTWTEKFFVAGLLFISLYALNDWLFLNVSLGDDRAGSALLFAKLGLSYLTIVVFFFLLFMKAFHGRARRRDLAVLLPTCVILVSCWTGLVTGVEPAPWGWKASFAPLLFILWVAYALTYMLVGIRYISRISTVLKKENPPLGRRTQRMVILFVAMILMGASTNMLFILLNFEAPPLFSSLLIIPGIALVLVLSPLTKDRIATFIKRWKSRQYEVRHAFLVYQNGTLIASRSEGDGTMVDKDIFAATLDAIQTFMRTSFPLLRGKWLKTIEHGEFRIILERGQKIYLAVVISGEENDQLRVMMKDVLGAVENQNSASLMDWSGIPEDVKGVKSALGSLFRKADVF